jgi:hypothetical protein
MDQIHIVIGEKEIPVAIAELRILPHESSGKLVLSYNKDGEI